MFAGAWTGMRLADRLQEDMRRALDAGDSLRASTIRLLRAAIRGAETERGRPLTDDEADQIVAAEVQRRRETVDACARAGREDLARRQILELAILAEYLPAGPRPRTR